MFKISEIISIPVISLYESEFQGIIYNILIDCKTKKVQYACILNEGENIQKSIHINDLYQIGKDCVFIKNNSSIGLECCNERILSQYVSGLNLPVYNIDGKFLGTSCDLEFNEKFIITKIILNNEKTIDAKNIISIGKSTILIGDSFINLNKFKPKLKSLSRNSNNEKKVYILSDIENIKKETFQKERNKITTNYNLLLGRKLNKSISAPNGELVAKENSIITKQTINKASLYGKLVEIARYSTKN